MRRFTKWAWVAMLGTTPLATAGVLLCCLPDPRDGETVTVIDSCDPTQLSTDPTSVDSTIRTYVEATKQFQETVQKADIALRDACLAVYKDPALGIPPPISAGAGSGREGAAACQPLLTRIASTVKGQPTPPGVNNIPAWIEIHDGERCVVPVGAREKCLSGCSAPCDVSKCEPGKIVGKCPGDCFGTCSTTDIEAGVPCSGTCIGEIPIPDSGGVNPGGTCQGECTGTCGGAIYTGNCEGACASEFTGRCGGTCHGTCNGVPLAEVDAGTPQLDGAAAPLDVPPPANNSPGNCGTGTCVGTCSDRANGTCFARCVNYAIANGAYTTTFAKFSSAQCVNSVCVGTCRSAQGSGAATATGPLLFPGRCKGECTELTQPLKETELPENTKCAGICRPLPGAPTDGGAPAKFCSVDLDPTSLRCEGSLTCGQNQNAECSNACEARAALDAVCGDPLVMQIYAVTDPDLYRALRANADALGRAISLLRKARRANAFIGNRTLGDFVKLGARGDLAYACVNQGIKNAAAANETLAADTAADPSAVRPITK